MRRVSDHDEGGSEEQAVAHHEVRSSTHELSDGYGQGLVARATLTGLAHERAVGTAQILNLQGLTHPQHRVLPRHRGIIDANRACLVASDGDVSNARQIKRPYLFARENDQLIAPPRRHQPEYTSGHRRRLSSRPGQAAAAT